MFKIISNNISRPSVFRKIAFAVTHLPSDYPNYWETVVNFATEHGSKDVITKEEARILVENIEELDSTVFDNDAKLVQDLLRFQINSKPLGVILISSQKKCVLCTGKLILRKDRPSSVVIYDDIMGSLPGSHFYKYCTNPSCGCVQYYGYYTTGGSSATVLYNVDWESLPYFVSSRETVFSMKLLRRFNAEILIGQQSFLQCSDMYNFLHKYSGQGILQSS